MPHGILLKLSYPPSSSPLHTHYCKRPHTARMFEDYMFGCVTVRAVELITQVLWLLKFLQKKFCCCHLYGRFTIGRFSPSLIHFYVDLMGNLGYINEHFEKFCSILTYHLFGKWQAVLHMMCLHSNLRNLNSFRAYE